MQVIPEQHMLRFKQNSFKPCQLKRLSARRCTRKLALRAVRRAEACTRQLCNDVLYSINLINFYDIKGI